jgi:gluconate 2-dehydrogenase gamma chain
MTGTTGHHEPQDETRISRREVLRRAALLAGVALSPELLTFVGRAQSAAAKTYLTTAQGAIVSAAAERILPRTETPGALDAGVPAFIDRFYGEFSSPEEQQLLLKGLEDIDAAARAAHGAPFASLAPAQQDGVLHGVANAQQGLTSRSFELLRSTTVLGYFTSEVVGKEVLHYDPVPGAYDGCVPIDQVGRRNWTT